MILCRFEDDTQWLNSLQLLRMPSFASSFLFFLLLLSSSEVILKKIELIEKIKKYLLSYFANLSIIFFRLTSAGKLL